MLIDALVLAISPVERALANRRWIRMEVIEPALRRAFPPPPPKQDLERLAITAEAAVESEQLRRSQRRSMFRRQ